MYCPYCRKEFNDGRAVCPDCKRELVTGFPEEDGVKAAGMDPVKLKSAANDIEAELILNLLANNNIPCFKKNKGSGGYMNIYMGYSIFGEDIYVDKKDYPAATDLLNDLQPDDEPPDYENVHPDYKLPFYRNPRIVARILLIVMGAAMLLSAILNTLK